MNPTYDKFYGESVSAPDQEIFSSSTVEVCKDLLIGYDAQDPSTPRVSICEVVMMAATVVKLQADVVQLQNRASGDAAVIVLADEQRESLDWLRADLRMESHANQSTWETRYLQRRARACDAIDKLLGGK